MPELFKSIAISIPGHRITVSMTVVLCQQSHERIRVLGPGLILVPTSAADRAGMLDATCDGHWVRVFQRDLMEKSQPIESDMRSG
jgi:hypothetical protein